LIKTSSAVISVCVCVCVSLDTRRADSDDASVTRDAQAAHWVNAAPCHTVGSGCLQA